MRKLNILLLMLLTTASFAVGQKPNILVDADWLSSRMEKGNLVIFHIGREADYEREHIPGATYISASEYTFDDEDRNIIFDRPEDAVLKELFESKGLSNSDEVVIYTPGGWIPLVTRLYFTLDYLGHGDKTYILNGGLAAWKAGDKEVTSEKPKSVTGKFNIKPNKAILADTDYVKRSLGNVGNTIIDCRSEVYYNGIESTHGARTGRVPGAVNIPYTSLYGASDIGAYLFSSEDEMNTLFTSRGLDKSQPLVLYCHIGMQLTVVYAAAKILGYRDVRMYDGSFNVWGKDDSLPVETQ